jgi:hypothetical protein
MNIVILFVALVIVLFGFVVLYGAPFVPTLRASSEEALDLLDLKPGETLLELGSGDGRILRAAAKRGIRSIGYELNPLLVLWSRVACWKYRRLVTVNFGNYWQQTWPPTDGIYIFLLDRYMEKLDKKIIQEIHKKVKLVSFAFAVPGRRAAKEQNGLFLYSYAKPTVSIENQP